MKGEKKIFIKFSVTMEIKINKEVKNYHENMCLGLSGKQCICSVLAVSVAVGTYFGLRDIIGKEIVSWLCVLLAAPFAAAGFFKYNGMTFEKFAAAYIRSEFLASGRRVFKSENILYRFYREVLSDDVQKSKQSKKGKKKNT
ncbi:MAG: PrgI family protein [Clostridia bacterium]|nr:PrgI family protein [Clostridia bacterium]